MGRRQNVPAYKVFDTVDISINQTQIAPYTTIDAVDKIGIELDWNGTSPVGAFFVDVAYYYPKTATYSTFVPLDFGASIAISGNTGQHLLVIQDPPFDRIRLRYVKTSGTGTLTATLSCYGKGA